MFELTRKPIHPGIILKEDLLNELNISEKQLSKDINIDIKVIKDIIEGKASITKEIAEKLAEYFKTSKEMWLNLQKDYDYWTEKQKKDKKKVS